MNKRKLKILIRKFKSLILLLVSKIRKIKIKPKYLLLSVLIVIIIFLVIITVGGYKKLSKLDTQIDTIAMDIQVSYSREFTLVERIKLIEITDFKSDCTDFSYRCLYIGDSLRKEMLEAIKGRSFNDEEMEVINMISSIEVSTRAKSEEFNTFVEEYNQVKEEFPFSLVSWVSKSKQSLN